VEHPFSSPDQSPPNYVDVLDDDFWFDQIFRTPKLIGLLSIERLEKELQSVASAEFQRADSKPQTDAI